jgi:hypothetical protein
MRLAPPGRTSLWASAAPTEQAAIRSQIEAVQRDLEEAEHPARMAPDALERLGALKGTLDGWSEAVPDDAPLEELRGDVTLLEADERADPPGRTAQLILFSRIPEFVFFDEDAGTYRAFLHSVRSPPPG